MKKKKCVICGKKLAGRKRTLCGATDCQHQYNADKQKRYRQNESCRNRNQMALDVEGKKRRITSPLVRYYGGKWRIAKWIEQQFPPHTTYVEPFCGAANILFRKQPSKYEVIT